jgi:hypothetical protein
VWKCDIVAHQLRVSLPPIISGDGATICVCYILGVERWKKSYRLAVYGEWKLRECCAVPVVVTCWSVAAGGQGSCASPRGIYGEQSAIVTVYTVITSVLLSVSLHQ